MLIYVFQPPYVHANRKKLQEKIINEKLKLPPRLTGEAHSLLKGVSSNLFVSMCPIYFVTYCSSLKFFYFISCYRKTHPKDWAVGLEEEMKSSLINGFGQSTGRNWRPENFNLSSSQMSVARTALQILINAGLQCLLTIRQLLHLHQASSSRGILM